MLATHRSIVSADTQHDGGTTSFPDANGILHPDDGRGHYSNTASASAPDSLVTSLQAINKITDPLGLPWKSTKDVDFSTTITYVGFCFDIPTRTVSLPDDKRERYRAQLTDWLHRSRFTLDEAEQLHGRLQHATFVHSAGRKRLAYFRLFLRQFSSPTVSNYSLRYPPRGIYSDLRWWSSALSSPGRSRNFSQDTTLTDLQLSTDASLQWGIGVVCGSDQLILQLKPQVIQGNQGILWAETIALEIGLRVAIDRRIQDTPLAIYCDNAAVIAGGSSGHMRDEAAMESLLRIRELEASHNIDVHPVYIRLNALQQAHATNYSSPPTAAQPPSPATPSPSLISQSTLQVYNHPRPIELPRRPRVSAKLLPSHPSRSDCPAVNRLLLWDLPHTTPSPPTIESQRISQVIAASWAPSTRTTYASGILHWHLWALRSLPPDQCHLPIPIHQLLAFIAAHAGDYAGSTIKNWVAGIRAFHLAKGHLLNTKDDRVQQALTGAARLTPASSARPPRPPYTASLLASLKPHFNLHDPFDAAVWALMLSAFWGLARLGELTTKSLAAFTPRTHPTRAHAIPHIINNALHFNLHLPWTKTSAPGGNLIISTQLEPICPVSALQHHFRLNPGAPTSHIFSHGPNSAPMTRSILTQRIQQAAIAANQPTLPGHSFRIGGCTEFLLRGTSLDAVRIAGRWSSDSWKLYIRRHVELLVPALANAPNHAAAAVVTAGAPGQHGML
ncbi:hypothetical protein CF335_g5757 [Tilletia laevis]|nr:hypothetical protein CF335_g5757 [Tilletia laevis]